MDSGVSSSSLTSPVRSDREKLPIPTTHTKPTALLQPTVSNANLPKVGGKAVFIYVSFKHGTSFQRFKVYFEGNIMTVGANNQPMQPQDQSLFAELSEQEQEAVAGGLDLFSFDFDDLKAEIPNGTLNLSPFNISFTIDDTSYTAQLTEPATISIVDGTLTGTGGNLTVTSS